MTALLADAITVVRQGQLILNEASLCVPPGQLQAMAGPNGSGKSTLLRALAGLWRVTTGEVLLDGRSLARYSRAELARRVAFVPQDARMDWPFTVEEMVAMGRHPHRGRFARESEGDRRAIEAALRRCDVASLRDRLVTTLSGGERQRVLIARSLAVEPEVILLDEPTASLDVQHAIEVLELCRELARSGLAVAMATHDLNAAARHCSRVALVSAGRVVAEGPCGEVLTPAALRSVFGVRPEVLTTGAGDPVFVFHRKEFEA